MADNTKRYLFFQQNPEIPGKDRYRFQTIATQRRRLSKVLSAIAFSTTVFHSGSGSLSAYTAVALRCGDFSQYAYQVQSFEYSLLGLSGNINDLAVRDLRRILQIHLQHAPEEEFGNRIVPHSSPSVTLNAQQHARVCSVVTSYRLIDILARVNNLSPSNVEVSKGYGLLDKELDGYKQLRAWPALCFKFREVFKAQATVNKIICNQSSSHRLLDYIEQNAATGYSYKVTNNILVAATHLAFIFETQFSTNVLPDLPDFINDECIKSSQTAQEQDFLARLRKLIFDHGLRPDECLSGLSLSSFRAPLQLAVNVSPIYLLIPLTIAKRMWNRQIVNNLAIHLGNRKHHILVQAETVLWSALFAMAVGKMALSEAITYIMDKIDWESLQKIMHSEEVENVTEFFNINTDSDPSLLQLSTNDMSDIRTPSFSEDSGTPGSPSMDIDGPPPPSHDVLSSSVDSNANGIVVKTLQVNRVDSTSPHNDAAKRQSRSPASNINTFQMDVDDSPDLNANGINSMHDPNNGRTSSRSINAVENQHEDEVLRRSTRLQTQHGNESRAGYRSQYTTVRPKTKKPRLTPKAMPTTISQSPSIILEDYGSRLKPIDVDFLHHGSLWEPDGLDAFRVKRETVAIHRAVTEIPGDRAGCQGELYAFTALGKKVELEPKFHFESYAIRFSEIMRNVQAHYDEGLPPHCQMGGHSLIKALTWDEYKQMKPEELHKILLMQNIVVSGDTAHTGLTGVKFDENGLEQIFSIHDEVSLQDYSLYEEVSGGDEDETIDQIDEMTMHLPRTVSGTLQDVLASSQNDNGTILNALDLPLSASEYTIPMSFSSDKTAHHFTKTSNSFTLRNSYPFEDLNWGLIGTKDTITFTHIDSDGLGTFIRILCGCKIWFLLRPKHDTLGFSLSSRHMFMNDAFRLDRVLETAHYDFEAVALMPGDLLIMRPNQPHAVFGNEHTVCVGGHFYLTGLMEITAQGVIHAFVLNEFISNTDHYKSRQLFQRILDFCSKGLIEGKVKKSSPAYAHIPDVTTFEGIINLLSLCNLVILGNVLDFRTYLAPNQPPERNATPLEQEIMEQYDRNKISKQERVATMYYRGLAFEVIDWLKARHRFWNPSGEVVDMPSHYLAQQLRALLQYKTAAELRGYAGAPHCTYSLLSKQVDNLVRWNAPLESYWSSSQHRVDDTQLGFGDRNGWRFEFQDACEPYSRCAEYELISKGTTELDRIFQNSEKSMQSRLMPRPNLSNHRTSTQKRVCSDE